MYKLWITANKSLYFYLLEGNDDLETDFSFSYTKKYQTFRCCDIVDLIEWLVFQLDLL